MRNLFSPQQNVRPCKKRPSESDDPPRAMFVGQASGERSDHGPRGAHNTESPSHARAEPVVAIEQKRQRRPETTERSKNQRADDRGLPQQRLRAEERPERLHRLAVTQLLLWRQLRHYLLDKR